MREQLYAFEPTALLAYLDRVENASARETEISASVFSASVFDDIESDSPSIYHETAAGATIAIEGPLSMSGPPPIARFFGFGGTSYRDIMAAAAKARAAKPKAVVLAINSPGGEVAGVDQAWQAIRAMAEEIPTTAVNGGMMASAAYWLASAAGRIESTSPATEQGSIGVIIAGIDDSKMGEKMGFRLVKIVSRRAPRKGADVDTSAGREVLQKRADDIEAVFLERVATGRGKSVDTVAETFGQGALLVSRDALAAGMIDAIVAAVPAGARAQTPGAVAQTPGMPLVIPVTFPVADMSRNLAANFPAARAAPKPAQEAPMTLAQLLQTDPQARTEYEAQLKAERDAGRKDVQARIDSAKPFLALIATPTGYAADDISQIQKLAADVISGTEDLSALRSFIRYVDRDVEKRKAAAAVTETAAVGATPAQTQSVSQPGAVVGANPQTAEADLAAIVAKDKAAAGRK